MKKNILETTMVKVQINDFVKEIRTGRIGVVKNIKIVPDCNDADSPLIGILVVKMINEDGQITTMSASADKFSCIMAERYEESYFLD